MGMPPEHVCPDQVCVLDVLRPMFGDQAVNIALNYTCFPMSCTHASEQAHKLISRIKDDGLTIEAALAEIEAAALAEIGD